MKGKLLSSVTRIDSSVHYRAMPTCKQAFSIYFSQMCELFNQPHAVGYHDYWAKCLRISSLSQSYLAAYFINIEADRT